VVSVCASWSIACVMLLAGCPSSTSEVARAPAGPEHVSDGVTHAAREEKQMTELTMALTAWLENDVLALRYSVTNHSDRDVYLLNRVPDLARQTRPDIAYIELRKEERLVDVQKDIPRIPQGMAPTLPQSPHVTSLRAHQTFVETINIAVPVREYRAYTGKRPDGPETLYEQIKLTIGYYWAVPGMTESTKRSANGLDILIPMPPPGTKLEFGHLVGTAKLSIPVREPSIELEPTHP
jgi:hypothetical protein